MLRDGLGLLEAPILDMAQREAYADTVQSVSHTVRVEILGHTVLLDRSARLPLRPTVLVGVGPVLDVHYPHQVLPRPFTVLYDQQFPHLNVLVEGRSKADLHHRVPVYPTDPRLFHLYRPLESMVHHNPFHIGTESWDLIHCLWNGRAGYERSWNHARYRHF